MLAAAAVLALALAQWLAWQHPLWHQAMSASSLLVALVCGRWPALVLPLLAACLPVAQFAPWTGWNVVTEFDLLALSAAAGGLLHLAIRPAQVRPPPLLALEAWAAAGILLAGVIGLVRGLVDAGGEVLAFQTQYTDAPAAVLAFKPLALVLVLWPVLRQQLAQDARRALQGLALGMCIGVSLVAAAVAWERLAMVGLGEFSRPYRAVGTFWEMHVGGAAIDAYLAMAMPFVAWAVWSARRPLPWLAAAALAIAAGYACLTTFSRGVYGAVLLPLPWLAWLLWRRLHRQAPALFVRATALAVVASGGVAALVVAGYLAHGRWGALLSGAVGLGAMAWWTRHAATPWAWRRWAARALAALLVLEVLVVVSFGNFLVDRLKQADHDLGDRLSHWAQGVRLLHDPADRLLGIGLGRLPAHLSRFAPGYELSGALGLQTDAHAGPVLRLSGPRTRRTLAGQFAISQRVDLVPGRPHRVELDYAVQQRTDLGLSVCEMHLLYERRCQLRWVRLSPGPVAWQRLSVDLKGPALGVGLEWAPRMALFQISVLDEGHDLRLTRVRVVAPDGRDLQRNGDLRQGLDHWLPVATSYFHPWHIDNLYLEWLIERGPLGLVSFLMLLLLLVRRLGAQATGGTAPAEAAFLAAALVGVGLVGLMSSVLDTGRAALLLVLLVAVALAIPGRPATSLPARTA